MPTPTIESLRFLRNAGVFADVPTGALLHKFKPYNLVYGFNGSGKTTLSRLIESLGDAGLSENLADGAEFAFALSDGSTPSHSAPKNVASRYISVFNEDYVDRTLTWKDGTARPIIYLGQEQAELAAQLAKLEADESAAAQEETLRNSEFSSARRALETKRRDVARLIAEELALGRRYTAANLKADYDAGTFTPESKLHAEERRRLKEVINRTDLPAPIPKLRVSTSGDTVAEFVSETLSTQVAEVAIAALERRKDALVWVQEGIDLHSNEEDCLFCGGSLTSSRVEALRTALRSGFDTLASKINEAQQRVEAFRQACQAQKDWLAGLGEALPNFKSDLSRSVGELLKLPENGLAAGAAWRGQLEKKRANPDAAIVPFDLHDASWDGALAETVGAFNVVVENNNAALADFSNEQARAREKLKAHHLADHQTAYEQAVAADSGAAATKDSSTAKLADIRAQIGKVREQLRSHGPAAAELNKLLKSYLGHSQISLEATEDGYKICRDGKVSRKPLSEGEKTAVAFCYFLTSLQSEGRKISDLIIVLDDPISSLDARAMTHVVALIRKRFSTVSQLFLLTHNLEFMREMKKWLGKRYENETAEFLFVETGINKDGKRSSTIVKLPKLIRDYESEYHYLYSLVRFLAEKPDDTERFAYLMPNAIRKVLDIFLAFKDPGASGLEPKVDNLLRNYPDLDAARVKGMERLAQLESHSESIGDVITFSAYTLSQVADAAKCLLELIELVDPGHKKAMDRLCN